MEVDHRGLQGAMAEILLDQSEVDPGFEQVGRVAVPEGIDRDLLFDAEIPDHPLDRAMDTGTCHRFSGGTGLFFAASYGRKEPDRVSMGCPIATEDRQAARWQGDIAVLGALAAMDVDDHAGVSMSPTWRFKASWRRRPSE